MQEKGQQYPYYSQSLTDVYDRLGSGEKGLTTDEVILQREKFGWNDLPEGKHLPWYLMLLKQFKDLMVLILLTAAAISFFTGHMIDVYVILVVVAINGLIGFVQELKAQRAVASLKHLLVKTAKVFRDGELITINARELVPGDVVSLEEGDFVPADIRIIVTRNGSTIESSLTGESMPIQKEEGVFPDKTPLAERKNMLYNGTHVATGSIKGVVVAIGDHTELGKIATDLADIKTEQTNFQRKTNHLARQMAFISVLSATIIFVVGYFFRSFELEDTLLVTIAALVASIPEGLPAMLSVVLAVGAGRMAKRKAIVREFTAAEGLGAVSVILSDKTGTITENSLNIKRIALANGTQFQVSGEGYKPEGDFYDEQENAIDPSEHEQLRLFLNIARYCNNADIRHDEEQGKHEAIGDPTEAALEVVSQKAGHHQEWLSSAKKLYDFPFNAAYKYRASLVEDGGKKYIYVVGAPERIMTLTTHFQKEGKAEQLDANSKQELQNTVDQWAEEAMRVLTLAYKEVSPDMHEIKEEDVTGLTWVGVSGIMDPPRAGVKESVLQCKKAGVKVIMATGDHKKTAVAIAKSVGILDEGATSEMALTEQELEAFSEEEFDQAISELVVFARLTPSMKLRIATRLQAMGHLIAMTGDGVNDAPALKKADVGISMGIMGTDVAREASRLVLADDNFSTIVSAVEEGRIVFNNARRTSFFLLTTNFAETLVLIFSMILGLPFALTATQILWLNLVSDGVLVLPLALERGHGLEMKRKPHGKNTPILDKKIAPFLLINASIMVIFSLLALQYYLPQGIEKSRAGVFFVMAVTQVFNVFNMRDLTQSVFKVGLTTNKYVLLATFTSFLLTLVVIELPLAQKIFQFSSLPWLDVVFLTGISSMVLWCGEIYKWISNK